MRFSCGWFISETNDISDGLSVNDVPDRTSIDDADLTSLHGVPARETFALVNGDVPREAVNANPCSDIDGVTRDAEWTSGVGVERDGSPPADRAEEAETRDEGLGSPCEPGKRAIGIVTFSRFDVDADGGSSGEGERGTNGRRGLGCVAPVSARYEGEMVLGHPHPFYHLQTIYFLDRKLPLS